MIRWITSSEYYSSPEPTGLEVHEDEGLDIGILKGINVIMNLLSTQLRVRVDFCEALGVLDPDTVGTARHAAVGGRSEVVLVIGWRVGRGSRDVRPYRHH